MKKKITGLLLASLLLSAPVSADTYTVANGDYLGKIALKFNTSVEAIKKANGLKSDFLQIGQKLQIPDKKSNAGSSQIKKTTTAQNTITPKMNVQSPQVQKTAVIKSDNINLREKADASSKLVTVLKKGSKVELVQLGKEWSKIKVNNKTGYVVTTALSYGQSPSRSRDMIQDRFYNVVNSLLGTPYVWGGTTPQTGFDCSGFAQYIMKQFGVNLPRTAAEQIKVGQPVEYKDLQPGDLMFFDTFKAGKVTHVAVYYGNGKIAHAGDTKANLILDKYLHDIYPYYGARRVL